MESKKIRCVNKIKLKKINFEFNDESPAFCKAQIIKKKIHLCY